MEEISKKVQEIVSTWYGRVTRREVECVHKRVMVLGIPVKRSK